MFRVFPEIQSVFFLLQTPINWHIIKINHLFTNIYARQHHFRIQIPLSKKKRNSLTIPFVQIFPPVFRSHSKPHVLYTMKLENIIHFEKYLHLHRIKQASSEVKFSHKISPLICAKCIQFLGLHSLLFAFFPEVKSCFFMQALNIGPYQNSSSFF